MTKYQKQTLLLAAVDCIIFGFNGQSLNLLLIQRSFEPEIGSKAAFVKRNIQFLNRVPEIFDQDFRLGGRVPFAYRAGSSRFGFAHVKATAAKQNHKKPYRLLLFHYETFG